MTESSILKGEASMKEFVFPAYVSFGKMDNAETEVRITLTDEEDIPDVLTKLRVIYKNIMKLDYDNLRTRHSAEIYGATDVKAKSPLEHFGEFYEQQNGQVMSEEQQKFMADMIEQIWGDER